MTYVDRISALKDQLEAMGSPARLDLPFEQGRPPTQAFSEFLTNKEQGDWAERTFVVNFNRTHERLWAVKYGRSEDLVAGEPGFDAYYRAYQAELGEIGKRPDLLVFDRREFAARHGSLDDISTLPRAELDLLVPSAALAVEVRSSAFLSARYELFARDVRQSTEREVMECARLLLDRHRDVLADARGWIPYLERTVADGLDPEVQAPRAMGRRSTAELTHASDLTRRLKNGLKALAQRDFLSLTPKAEDLSQVYRWIKRYGVPHHYCQVFFDRAVILSFEEILAVLADPARENRDFFIETDEKNQGKVTFKINVQLGREVLTNVVLPRHSSAMKELPKGRLLFYVHFEPSLATMTDRVFVHD
jgi:AccI restriction endonuclease